MPDDVELSDTYREYAQELLTLGPTLALCAQAMEMTVASFRYRLAHGPTAALIALARLDDATVARQIAAIRIGTERRKQKSPKTQ